MTPSAAVNPKADTLLQALFVRGNLNREDGERQFLALLDEGWHPNTLFSGQELHVLFYVGHPSMTPAMIDQALAHGLDPNQPTLVGLLKRKVYPVHRLQGKTGAAFAIAERLLDAGMNLDMQDSEGHTALHHALSTNDYLWMAWLISHGANPDIVNHQNQTARELAGTFFGRISTPERNGLQDPRVDDIQAELDRLVAAHLDHILPDAGRGMPVPPRL
jgi:hypothetical protein